MMAARFGRAARVTSPLNSLNSGRRASRRTATGWAPCVRGERSGDGAGEAGARVTIIALLSDGPLVLGAEIRFDDARVLLDRLRWALGDLLSKVQDRDDVGDLHDH